MATIKEMATNYVAPETKNIAELDAIPVDVDVQEKEFTREDGSTFKILAFEFQGEEYRMPKSVLKQLKAQIEAKPDMSAFKVTKEGEGMKTEYTVIPLN